MGTIIVVGMLIILFFGILSLGTLKNKHWSIGIIDALCFTGILGWLITGIVAQGFTQTQLAQSLHANSISLACIMVGIVSLIVIGMRKNP